MMVESQVCCVCVYMLASRQLYTEYIINCYLAFCHIIICNIVDHYEIERQDARDGIWVPVGSSSDPHFVADGLTKGQNYKFRVRVWFYTNDKDL